VLEPQEVFLGLLDAIFFGFLTKSVRINEFGNFGMFNDCI